MTQSTLMRTKLFQSLESAIARVSDEMIARARPLAPMPDHAVVLGALPETLIALFAVVQHEKDMSSTYAARAASDRAMYPERGSRSPLEELSRHLQRSAALFEELLQSFVEYEFNERSGGRILRFSSNFEVYYIPDEVFVIGEREVVRAS